MAPATNGAIKARESNVDVLIIGAGPAGVMAGAWMAKAGINARIVDKRGSRILDGHADGLSPRSVEILESLGVYRYFSSDDLTSIESLVNWATDEHGQIKRAAMTNFTHQNGAFSKKIQTVTDQGTVEGAYRQFMRERGIQVEQAVLPVALAVDNSEQASEYPVTVRLQHLDETEAPPYQPRSYYRDCDGNLPSDDVFKAHLFIDDTKALMQRVADRRETEEIVHAKYVIGCEGAHSWTRRQLGIEMRGAATDAMFGVVDVRPLTDFPDIRKLGMVSSPHGQLLIIPREYGLVRFYVPQDGIAKADITPRTILAATNAILAPYKVDYQYCDWWTAYKVGQRIGSHYNDPSHRVFLAGDAVHTHSPKEGQGMNTSMGDTHNLGWKIAGVLKGQLDPAVLQTYEAERRPVAKRLINFDRKMAAAYGAREMDLVHRLFVSNLLFWRGGGVLYSENALLAAASTPVDLVSKMPDTLDDTELGGSIEPVKLKGTVVAKSELAKGMEVGLRLECYTIWRHADATKCETQDLVPGDGKWRIIVFGGNVTDPKQMIRVNKLGEQLGQAGGLLSRYTPSKSKITSTLSAHGYRKSPADVALVQVLLLHSSDVNDFEFSQLHPTYFPSDPHNGTDYSKVYAASVDASVEIGQSYAGLGIDPHRGCVGVFRPDQHIALVTDLEDVDVLEKFFGGFMLRQDQG